MNYQETFDKVANHLITQGVKSSDEICLYRGPNGTKCAIGCLIPDDNYDPEMDFLVQFDLVVELPGVRKMLGIESVDDEEFLKELQHAHDSYEPKEWKTFLRKVAEKWSLNVPDCLQLTPKK